MIKITAIQRKVLEGKVYGSKPGAGLYPATVWKLTATNENVTRTVEALIAKGFMTNIAGRAAITEAGRAALAGIKVSSI